MGCGQTKSPSPEVENPCKALISLLYDSLQSSRNNLSLLEPAYYFINLILESSVRKQKEFSKVLSEELKNFQLNLHVLIREKVINEKEFLKFLMPVESAYNTLFSENNFNLHARINNIKNINDLNSKKSEEIDKILDEFFLHEAADFWIKHFKIKENCSWQTFDEKFSTTFMPIFDKDIQFLPSEKKSDPQTIKNNIKLLLKYYLDSENIGNVSRDGWNAFSFKVFSNFIERTKFVEKAAIPHPTILNNKVSITEFYNENEFIDESEQTIFVVSPEGATGKKQDSEINVKKDLAGGEFLLIGRQKEKNDIRLEQTTISRNHCHIALKKNLEGQTIRNEYYISNKSNSYIYFVVEEEGYQLSKNMVIRLSENKIFTIRDIYPEFAKKDNLLSVEPQFFGAKRVQQSGYLMNNRSPFIEIEFLESNKRETKSVKNEEEDYTFNIGSGPKDTIQVHDKGEEDQEIVEPDHCQIKYDATNQCWLIKDQHVVQPGNKTVYKTLIRCFNHQTYEDFDGTDGKSAMSGIKLRDRMKFMMGEAVFQVKEIN